MRKCNEKKITYYCDKFAATENNTKEIYKIIDSFGYNIKKTVHPAEQSGQVLVYNFMCFFNEKINKAVNKINNAIINENILPNIEYSSDITDTSMQSLGSYHSD